MPETVAIPCAAGAWPQTPDALSTTEDGHHDATAVEGSDAWHHRAYGFVHDTEHALLLPLAVGEAMDVSFRAAWSGQSDQAGLFVRSDDEHWVKAGIARRRSPRTRRGRHRHPLRLVRRVRRRLARQRPDRCTNHGRVHESRTNVT